MKKKAIVLCSPDAYANSVKPKELKNFLENNGYNVNVFSTTTISRAGSSRFLRKLPGLKLSQLRIYLNELVVEVCQKFKSNVYAQDYVARAIRHAVLLRGKSIYKKVNNEKFSLLICESAWDQGIFLMPRIADLQILDLPSPFAEEIYFGGGVSKEGYTMLREFEKNIYSKADYLSFHWHTYTEYVKKNKYNGNNFLNMTYGVSRKNTSAKFSKEPKIIFLGFLKGYWVNLTLLERLCEMNPNIDVYGGPKPPKNSKINYKGYAPTTEVLSNYQYGLITITDDPLRKLSFSSKHLEYASFGLPVLTPTWRRDRLLDDSSIYYNINNFTSELKKYSDESSWLIKSKASLKLSQGLCWDKIFSELKKII